MKILILNGSPRDKGATSIILKKLCSYLVKYKNVDITYINVSSLESNYCTGCCICYKSGSCFMKDDLENLSIEISKSDGVILATPTYVSNVSGQMKTIIDRGHFVLEQLLYGKYAMSIVTYENYGGKTASNILDHLLAFSGAKISASIIIKNPFNNNPLNDNINRMIKKKAEKFYNDIKNKKKYIFQSLKHFIVFNVGIKPHIIKNKVKYKGLIEKHWKKRNLL